VYTNPVSLPETIDLGPYMDLESLPSVMSGRTDQIAEVNYDLVSVNNWISRHYIGYTSNKIRDEDMWVMFNDMHSVPERKTPFEGHADVRSTIPTDS
jgi:hypothetical protein